MIDPDTGEVIFPFLRTPYNYDTNAASDMHAAPIEGPSMTQQSFAEEVDINTIVRRFGLTGELPQNVVVPQVGDFTAVTDFQTAMNVVRSAEEAFAEMPADVRERFSNDPGKFMDFVHDPANRDDAKKLGLLLPDPEPVKPVEVRVIPEPPAGGGTSST